MKINYQRLKQYLEATGSGGDKSPIKSWFSSVQGEKELQENSFKYWGEIQADMVPEHYDESQVLGGIYRKIKLREGKIRSVPSNSARILNSLAKIAAILFIPLLAYVIIINYSRSSYTDEIAFTEIYSPLGARTIFYLPDGSNGWLNGGSSLKFPEQFKGKTREISLKGEAYFNVVTNPEKPFVVSGEFLQIIAKGTSFNVRTWYDVPETDVVLVEGKLEIFVDDKDERKRIAELSPGQLLHFEPYDTGSYIKDADVEKYVSWTEGKLVFKEDPFTDVVKQINHWYNVNIIIEDEILKSYKYVATFKDETLDEILKMLTISAPLRYREKKRTQLADGTFEKRTIELYYKPTNSQ